MKSIREVITDYIKSVGGDGLCNPGITCGCSIDDLCLCETMDVDECVPAKQRACINCVYNGQCEMQDEWYLGDKDTDGCFFALKDVDND